MRGETRIKLRLSKKNVETAADVIIYGLSHIFKLGKASAAEFSFYDINANVHRRYI